MAKSCCLASRAAFSTAAPTVYVILLPPLEPAYGAASVSALTTRMSPAGSSKTSEAIWAKAVLVPLMSTVPTMIDSVPSRSRRQTALAGSMPPIQPPRATPTPRFSRGSDPAEALRHEIARGRGVPEPQVERVHGERAGHLVHLGFQGEGRLDGAGSTVGAVARLVGQHLVAADVHVGQAVAAAEHQAGDAEGRARIGAGVEDDARLERRQPAVLGDAGLELEDARGRGGGRQELLGAREHERDGPPESHRERRGERLEEDELAAEAAAERRRDDAHLVLGQAERFRHLGARVEERLGGGPHGDAAERVHLRHGRARLEVALVDDARAVGALDDEMRLGEALGYVAAGEVLGARDVGPERFPERRAAAGRAVLA